MKEIIIASILIALVLLVYYIIKKIQSMKVSPDPWDGENIKIDDNDLGVCINCGTPIKNKFQHYCPKCDNVTGQFTRYIPFVNISFNCSIFNAIIKKKTHTEPRSHREK